MRSMRRYATRRHASLALLIVVAVACSPQPEPTAGRTTSPTTAASATVVPTATSSGPASTLPSPSGSAATRVALEQLVGGLTQPLDLVAATDGSGRMFVAEQPGRVRIVDDGRLFDSPYLDIHERISSGGERGLLGIALHPDFPNDSRIFVDYTDLDGNTVVSSFTGSLDADAADAASERILLRVKQPFANHNGGALVFGPDGMLYIALGDGGSGGDPQGNGRNLKTHLAKILRIDVDVPAGRDPPYRVPPDNPYADGADGALPEIWLTGLRNPWRIRFDQATGDLWIGDVGQGSWEEIDVVRNGQHGLDFGWNTMEGFHCYQPSTGCDETGLTLPVAEYGHDHGCAVIGGVVVHDPGDAGLDGRYIFGDECSGDLWLMDPTGDARREPTLVLQSGPAISSISLDANGAPILTDLAAGRLYRIRAAPN